MPLKQCEVGGQKGWKWGDRGKCYIGVGGKARALRQARAIKASQAQNARTRIVPSNPLKADPTRSITLRRVFRQALMGRINRLKGQILRLVVDENAFGLKRHTVNPFTGNEEQDNAGQLYVSTDRDILFDNRSREPVHYQLSGKGDTRSTSSGSAVENQRFAFLTDAEKVKEFNTWLKAQMDAGILEAQTEGAYLQAFVEQGYRKGASRAFDDTRAAQRAVASTPQELAFFEGTKEEFLRSAFGRPVAIEKVQLLTGRVFTELQGVTDAMAQTMTRTLADGLVQGKNPRAIARDLNRAIDTIGRRRAEMIARTEIIRAHAEGQLDALEQMGVEEVGVAVEWSTAGDDRVCPLCQPLDGVVMKIKEARGILPRHVMCRCAFIPANVGESAKGEIRSKSGIDKAFDKSIKAEAPSKRTLAEQKERTRWAGADKRIAKKRPKSVV